MRVVLSYLLSGNPLIFWEMENLGWSYIGGSLGVVVAVILLIITRRNFAAYGLNLHSWRSSLDLGMTCYLILMIPFATMLALHIFAGSSYSHPISSVVIASANLFAIFMMLRIKVKENPNPVFNLTLLGLLLLFPLLLGAYLGQLNLLVVSTVVWQFLVSGFGEEILYRGYYQSRINEEYGRPWRILGADFGPGLIMSSLLFGLSHALNTFKPLEEIFVFDWGWAFVAFFSGLFFGLLRERTGSIVASGLAHGLPDAVGEALNLVLKLGLMTKG